MRTPPPAPSSSTSNTARSCSNAASASCTPTRWRCDMGLDMFAFTLPTAPDAVVDFTQTGITPVELHYWRKHPDLHGWMARLYREKGGIGPDFNCNTLVLTLDDLS